MRPSQKLLVHPDDGESQYMSSVTLLHVAGNKGNR